MWDQFDTVQGQTVKVKHKGCEERGINEWVRAGEGKRVVGAVLFSRKDTCEMSYFMSDWLRMLFWDNTWFTGNQYISMLIVPWLSRGAGIAHLITGLLGKAWRFAPWGLLSSRITSWAQIPLCGGNLSGWLSVNSKSLPLWGQLSHLILIREQACLCLSVYIQWVMII